MSTAKAPAAPSDRIISEYVKNFSKSIGILNRLKSILPTHVKVMINNALITLLSKINYGILTWRYES